MFTFKLVLQIAPSYTEWRYLHILWRFKMYCSKCGNQIAEDINFCPNCGNAVGKSITEMQENNNSEKEEILRNLNVALPIYQTIATVNAEIMQLRQDAQQTKTRTDKEITSTTIAGVLLISFFSLIISSSIKSEGKESLMSNLSFFLYIGIIVLGVYFINKHKKKTGSGSEVEKLAEEKERILDNYIKENNTPELYYLPEKYRYYSAAHYIKECIENKRAHNLTDAINLYEEQLHRWQMENYQQAMYILNQQQMAIIRLKS